MNYPVSGWLIFGMTCIGPLVIALFTTLIYFFVIKLDKADTNEMNSEITLLTTRVSKIKSVK
jgi:hypothetical protein